ncbi:MAG: HDOD domain-containing protein [Terriglobia bacterium]|jgi:putative nucleotidyltransferase with HDIG domain|nr:HDOD domain-containing protein [Terriglobia bacterium]
MSTMHAISVDEMAAKIGALDRIPSIPAILVPLLKLLQEPPETVDVQRVIELLGHDKSLAAQILQMANSPLFGRYKNVSTIRGAVLALGIDRVRQMATTCSILKMAPNQGDGFDVKTLWEHSLGVALVSRRFARRIGFQGPERAYLSGLLHDIGLIVNMTVVPELFLESARIAREEGRGFDETEPMVIGFGHGVTGALLAERWGLDAELKEVIRRHHEFERATVARESVALVSVADQLCRLRGLGYGFAEKRCVCLTEESAFQFLAEKFPVLWRTDLERFTYELDGYINEVRELVTVLFRLR